MKTFPFVLAGLAFTAGVFADTLATIPVGYLTRPLAGISGASASVTTFGIPLDDSTPPPAGVRSSRIEAFTATTITAAKADWTSSLADASSPWAVRITSGAAAGKTLDIAANTPSTLTVSGIDLTTLGLVAGTDTFELVPMDTLLSLFGTSTLLGGSSASTADNVQIRSGAAWLAYYFDTALGYWRRTTGPAADSSNVVIHPGAALQIVHRGPALNLTFTGRVLPTPFRFAVANSGSTGTHSGFPTDTTLGSFALQTLLPGWRAGSTPNNSDTLAIFNGNTSTSYLFNGTSWRLTSGGASAPNADSVAIPAGAVILLQRLGAAPGTTDLVRQPPFAL